MRFTFFNRGTFCTLLSALSALTTANAALTSADAVRAANDTVLPDVNTIVTEGTTNADRTFNGFGGLHPEQTGREQALWQDGTGVLLDPAIGAVVNCRDKTDPACRAVQVLDKGFPERPLISEDHLIGRDTVIENAGGHQPGIDNGTTGCKPVIVETQPSFSTETCRAGTPFEDRDCRRGVTQHGTTVSRLFSCGTNEATEKTLACRILSTMETTSDFIERCFFGTDELKPQTTIKEETTARATAVWPVICQAPQATTETVTCDEVLVIENTPVCQPGTSVSVTVTDSGSLTVDACPGGDRVTATHDCGAGQYVRFSISGFHTVTLGAGRTAILRGISNRRCRATLVFDSQTCTDAACVARWHADIRHSNFPLGTMTGTLVYPDDNASNTKETWVDNCKDLRK